MKGFYFLTLLATFLGTTAFGQTILLDQNFESGSLPAGWLRQQSTPSRGWEFGTNTTLSSGYLNFPEHTKFAASNDDKYDNQATTANVADRDMLITPALDLSNLSSARLTFSVYHTGAYGSSAYVEVSTDGGSTWSSIYTIQGSNSWQDLSLDLNAFLSQSNVKFAFVHNDGGEWADGVAVDDVKIFVPTPNDVQLVSIDVAANNLVGTVPVTITVRNYGTSVLNFFQFSWSTDGGTTTYTDPVNGLGLAPGATATITHNTPIIRTTDAVLNLDITTSLPNGQADFTANNNGTKKVTLLLGTAERIVLIEQHTGSWCQFCPDGSVRLKAILDANPDIIGIAIHNDDAMDFPDGNTVAGNFVSGFPSGTVDRVLFTGESEVGVNRTVWDSYSQLRKTVPSEVFIEADNVYDPNTRLLTVNVSAQFLASLSGNYRVNVFIVEDSITGTGSGYNQSNAYNGTAGHPYYQAGNPIQGYVHRHVARHFMGGAWGQAGVIPSTIVPLTPYNHTFTYTLPPTWNTSRIKLVAVVQKYGTTANDRPILNALEFSLNTSESNTYDLVGTTAGIEATTILHSECGGGKDGEIGINAVGCTDCTFAWSNGDTGNYVFGLNPGTYTVTMTNTSGISVTQSFNIYGPLVMNPTVTINNGNGDVRLTVTGGTPPYTYNWSNGQQGAIQNGLAQGLYEVTITDALGCSSVQTLKVGNITGINDIATINFNVYPNPTAGNVTVEADLANNTNVTIQVFNTLGALVSERNLNGLAQVREVIDLAAQANGVYIVKVTADGTTGVKRLVLNR